MKGPSRIDLSWTVPTSTGGADIDGYRIEYSDDDDDPATNTWRRLVANTMSDAVMYQDHGAAAELEVGDQRALPGVGDQLRRHGPASGSMRSDPTPRGPT